MDLTIVIAADRTDELKLSLFRFLERLAKDDAEGFAMHWSEQNGSQILHHVHFDSATAALAFEREWSDQPRS